MTSFDPRLRLTVLTDASQSRRPLIDVVGDIISAGAQAIIVREKHVGDDERSALIETIAAIAKPAGCVVIAASRSSVDVDGIHLAANDPVPKKRPSILGRSCHTLADVVAAEQQGCDYVTLSPIFLTQSKPGYGPALGTSKLEQVVHETNVAVLALGGVTRTNASSCLAAGAAGVAIMGEVMRSGDVTQLITSLRHELANPNDAT